MLGGSTDAVSPHTVQEIAKRVFGTRTRIGSVSEIRPCSEHGIPKVCGCNANLSYVVAIAGDPQRYVFRFNRGYRKDLFDKEAQNYGLIGAHTNIPVPRIHCIDKSGRLVPASYMVMDYMPGDEGFFLAHPDNPCTDRRERIEIQRQIGFCYAQIHNITRKSERPDSAIGLLLYRLGQLEHVVRDGQLVVDLHKIERCRAIIERDDDLLMVEESLCVNDSELHFTGQGGDWQVSFICDMEWVDFGHPLLDLVTLVCAPDRLWELGHALSLDVPDELSQKPYFSGYEELRRIDYSRLARVAIYRQLGVMCSIVDQFYRPEKRAFMESLGAVYTELLEAVASMPVAA